MAIRFNHPLLSGLAAARPGFATNAGFWYWASDTLTLSFSDGSGWIIMREPSQSFTPVWTNITLGNGTSVGTYQRSGGWCDLTAELTWGGTTASTGTNQTFSGWPVDSAGIAEGQMRVACYDNAASWVPGINLAQAATSGSLSFLGALNSAGTYAVGAIANATAPFVWAVGCKLRISGRFKLNTPYL